MTTALGQTLNLSYDSLRRLSSVSVGALTRQYLYRDISDTQTTTQVATVRYPIAGTSLNYDFNYTYDTLGNVSSCALPDGTTVSFTYDDQGQLLSVTGTGINFSYTYDNVGNILTASENGTNHTYTYGNSNWKDLLTTYDGKMIVFDTSGNPVSYYNGTRWSLSWRNGRSLTAASSGSTGISFTYDAGGMRTSKTVGNITSIYAYASGKLLREIRYNSADQTTDILDFFYAYDGTPYAMKYNGTVYYFVTNLQGDVVMILNANGSLAGGYVYDPYGKVLTATGTIANINPLRYRGYYYDTETGFYYLQNRYYDPEIGRFINADSYASTGQGIIGCNMFTYCGNNPIMYADDCGSRYIASTTVSNEDPGDRSLACQFQNEVAREK